MGKENGGRITTKEFYKELIAQNDKREKMHKELKDILLPLANQVENNTKEVDNLRAEVKKELNIRSVILGIMSIIAGGLGLSGK